MSSSYTPAQPPPPPEAAAGDTKKDKASGGAFRVDNPLPKAKKTEAVSVDVDVADPKDLTKFAKPLKLPFPWCFITKGSHETTVAEGELMVRKNVTYCNLPISMGAGYDVTRIEMKNVSRYNLFSTKLLCLKSKPSIVATMAPMAHTTDALLGPGDDEQFLQKMAEHAGPSRGKPALDSKAKPLASFMVKKRCGLNTTEITLYSNGMMSLDEKQRGCNLLRNIDVVHVEDISYIRYTFSGLCRKLLVGPENRLELGFLGDRYFLDSKMKAPDLQKVHKALLECCLGRKPSKPLQKWEGKVKGSWLKIRPEFTTVKMVTTPFAGLVQGTEVITIKTSEIAYLQATLPSWQGALIRAIRDIELYELSSAINRLMGEDMALIMVWPFAAVNDFQLSLALFIKAVTSVIAFIMVFFFRKTTLVIGGAGPAKETLFAPSTKPEEFLREFAQYVKAAQASFSWHGDGQGAAAAKLPGPGAKEDP